MRRYAELQGRLNGEEVGPDRRTYEFNPGEVWEENEFWIDLSWRIDPDGSLGVRQHFESLDRPGTPIGVDEYYGRIFADSVPGLAAEAMAAGVTPLEYMRDHAAFAVPGDEYQPYERPVEPISRRGVQRVATTASTSSPAPRPRGTATPTRSTRSQPSIGDGTPASRSTAS